MILAAMFAGKSFVNVVAREDGEENVEPKEYPIRFDVTE